MKVSVLAEKLNTTSEAILLTLKALKLKAKDADQEISDAVASVIKSEFSKSKKKEPSNSASTAKSKSSETKKIKKSEDLEEAATKKTVKPKLVKEAKEEKPKVKKSEKVDQVEVLQKIDKIQKVEKIEKIEKVEKKEPVIKETKDVKPAPIIEKPIKTETPVVIAKEVAPIAKSTPAPVSTSTSVPPKFKIGKEPVITLKPLAKKKRKPGHPDSMSGQGQLGGAQSKVPGISSGAPVAAQTPSASSTPENLKEIEIKVPITVKDLSVKLQQKPSVILKQLMMMGLLAHINQSLEEELVKKLCNDFGFQLAKVRTQEEQVIELHKQEDENPELLKARAPVVTFMGHVDHGKTSLIDAIRKSKVADSEHGGITQHMRAYSVMIPKGRITFLDTPGHEAFTSMRARGAHITDIVVLVVAADEGIMPQTIEAIDHANAANVPIVVALNKIDKRNADPERVKKQLMEIGLMPEDWGGKTVVVGVSATTGEGIDTLLEMLLLESEMLELKANPNKKSSGIVVEAHLSRGRGAVATLIVQSGTLKEGDIVVVGPYFGKVKAMFDDRQRQIKEAGPSMPVEVLGLSAVPSAGDNFYIVDDERQAREISERRREHLKNEKMQSFQKITLEDLYSKIQEGAIKELNIIIKADVQGSLEALRDSLQKIPSDKVKVRLIHAGVGDINTSDIILAVASKAIIIAFHVGTDPRAKAELDKSPVDIREYRIIYDAVNDIKKALEGLLETKYKKKFLSRIEIRQVFKLSKSGIVAGCYVQKGKVHRKANIDIVREDKVIYTGVITSLKRFKDDVRDVNEGLECGITIEGFKEIQPGDFIEAFELESITQKL